MPEPAAGGADDSSAVEAEGAKFAPEQQLQAAVPVESPTLRLKVDLDDNTDVAAQQGGKQQVQDDSSTPASSITVTTMAQLLKRPFGDVLKEIAANLQLKSTAHLAAEQLRYLLHHDSTCQQQRTPHEEVLQSAVLPLLVGIVRESPGLPASGSAMAVLAMLALSPNGRAVLRAEQAIPPVVRFLAINSFLQRPNAEPALLLLQNASCDKLLRHLMHKADILNVLLDMLANNAAWLKHHPHQAGPIAGTISNLVLADTDSTGTAIHRFVKAGGIELVCKVLSEWGRYDRSPATVRLQVLLREISTTPQYIVRVRETALDDSTSGTAAPTAAPIAVATAAAQLGSARRTSWSAGQLPGPEGISLDEQIKAVILGSPNMPASDRITAEVLKHNPDSKVL